MTAFYNMDGTQDRYTLVRHDSHLSKGKVKGANYKIKMMKRNAYGFRTKIFLT
ncbi:transposase [Segatella paludivivens]|uniref:transposase n=1 Tax=Segatella paludivivens TaxID=185294 RepID=UPI000376B831